MKKVIFVGGTSYSGSTFFDMVLSNDPTGFSCGEVNALFNPYRAYHLRPICGCGDTQCELWGQVLREGHSRLYQTIFNIFPEVEYIVDSSKNPFWIRSQMSNLAKQNIGFENVLIWKSPLDLAHSYKKRGQTGWDRVWLQYHRLYFTVIPKWIAINYRELVNNIELLEYICSSLGIRYHIGQEDYWRKQHHTLFGNKSAKIHLYPKDSMIFNKLAMQFVGGLGGASSAEELHRSIYSVSAQELTLEDEVQQKTRLNTDFAYVLATLEDTGVLHSSDGATLSCNSLRYSKFTIEMLATRYFVVNSIRKMWLRWYQ